MALIRCPWVASFLVALSAPAYQVQWVVSATSTNSAATDIAVDAQGNSIVVGRFSGDAALQNHQLTSAGGDDVFIAKLNPSGGVIWAVRGGGTATDVGTEVVIAADGSIFVLGTFKDTATFGAHVITNISTNNLPDGFLVKLDSEGAFQWAHALGGEMAVDARSMCLGSNERLWILGDAHSVFARSYDFSGALVQHFAPVVSGNCYGNGIIVDNSGAIYITGTFNGGSVDFGSTNLTFSGGGNAQYTLALGPDGAPRWAALVSASHYGDGFDVAVTTDGDIVTVGRIYVPYIALPYPTLFVMKHTPSGELLWSQQRGAHRSIFTAESVAVDSAGNIYTFGHHNDPYTNPDPRRGPLLTAWTPAGRQTVSMRFMSSADVDDTGHGHGIAIDASGYVHLSGYIRGRINFGGTNVVSEAPTAFIARVSPMMNPALEIQRSSGAVRISWPTAITGYTLQRGETMPSVNWSNVNVFPNWVGERREVVLSVTNAFEFFRLSAP